METMISYIEVFFTILSKFSKNLLWCFASYSIHPGESVSRQIQQQFPEEDDVTGYCGAAFNQSPPKHAPYAQNVRLDITSISNITYCECRGNSACCSNNKSSSRNNLWITPFGMSAFKQDEIGNLYKLLPVTITIHNRPYKLAGYSRAGRGHFTSVIEYNGKHLHYDVVGITKELRLSQQNTTM
jgi:hypothetical protein